MHTAAGCSSKEEENKRLKKNYSSPEQTQVQLPIQTKNKNKKIKIDCNSFSE